MRLRSFSLVVLCVLIFSCKKEKNTVIGFMVPTYEVARYTIDRDNFIARASELNAEVIATNAENNDQLQIKQAEELINQGAEIIVIIPVNQNTAAAIVRNAHNQGVKVIAYERLIRNCELDYFISFDHYIVGKEMARYAVNKVPSGNYVIISGDKGDKNAELIETGNKEILNASIQSGKINLIFSTFIEDWDPNEAYMKMKQILDAYQDNIDVVLSSNDGMAGGIIKALEEYNLAGKILITGLDAELPACQRIVSGSQKMTVYKPLKIQAKIAAEVAINLLKNEKSGAETTITYNGKVQVPTVSIKPIVVDKENIRQTIITDGFHSEKEIFSTN